MHGHLAKRYASNKRCVKCAFDQYGEGTGRPRQDARAAGQKFYAGRPCPQGHTKRYVSTGVCLECAYDGALSRSRQIRKSRPAWFSWHDAAAISRMRKIAAVMADVTGEPWELDHIIPIKGKKISGLHVAGNIQVMPRGENRRKSNSFNPQRQEVA